jgi:hypothetical protein
MNFHNNSNNKRGSPTMMKKLKVTLVPPQVAEKPAPPPNPAVNYKPLFPPRQNLLNSASTSRDISLFRGISVLFFSI